MRIVDTPAWQALSAHADTMHERHLRDLFAGDRERFQRFSLRWEGLLFDYSKQRVDGTSMRLLRELAQVAEIEGWKRRMVAGELLNHTENRAVRHMDLRAGEQAPPEVKRVLERMRLFCEAIHGGAWRGYSGERITHVVNIGIGGSDLGPRMATRALIAHHQPDIEVHFVANIDGADIAPLLGRLNPRSTLFIVASKTFTTLETLTNARTARDWLLAAAGSEEAVGRHFVALSTDLDLTGRFGIPADNVFEFWDWVGGRFSLWSAIGLSMALAIGWHNFERLLPGAKAMDSHFLESPAEENLPLTLALLSLWNTDFLGASTAAVLPYAQSFQLFPAYLQQLEMESNGKQTDRQGQPIGTATSPIIWGEAGTNGQHSFFQLFHQGGRIIPCDFIVLRESDLVRWSEHRQFPIIPCNLCGSQENLQRASVKAMLQDWDKKFPGRVDNMFTAMGNIVTSHMMDRKLFPFETIKATGSPVAGGDIAFDEEEHCGEPPSAVIRLMPDEA